MLLFTDIDGTLIDHHTYSFGGAREALQMLAGRGVPVIFCSSKTFEEQRYFQQTLGFEAPMILENGAAVAWPDNYWPISNTGEMRSRYRLIPLGGHSAIEIRALLRQWRETYGLPLFGYADTDDEGIAAATGLQGRAIQRAASRDFSETLLVSLSLVEKEVLKKVVAEVGLSLIQGGRFITIQSAGTNKGLALQWVAEKFFNYLGKTTPTLAIGDSPNDLPMLHAADKAALVQKPDGTWHDINFPGLWRVPAPGPEGFSLAVEIWLKEI